MIYNKCKKEIYNCLEDAAKELGISKEMVICGLKSGIFLKVPSNKLQNYIDNGIVELPCNTNILKQRYVGISFQL